MPTYTPGSAKQDPDTKAVAVRTIFPDMPDFADRQWGVMTVNNGGHYATNEQVANWPDMQAVPSWTPPASTDPEPFVPPALPEEVVVPPESEE